MNTNQNWHGTTIVLIRKGSQAVVAGDGQVSLGNTVLKSKTEKEPMYWYFNRNGNWKRMDKKKFVTKG